MKKSNRFKFSKNPLGLAIAACLFSFSVQAACIENGGTQKCSTPMLGPWVYQLCEEMAPYVSNSRRWCEVKGGTWQGSWSPCPGEQEVTQRNHEQFAQAFAASYFSPKSITSTTISEWGVESNSQHCHKGESQFIRPGLPIKEHKKFLFQNEDGGELTIWGLRIRPAICPPGQKLITESSKRAYCALEINEECLTGNPVNPISGEKVYSQQDYQHVHGLNLRRNYRNWGDLVSQASTTSPHKLLGSKWWYEGEKRLAITSDSDFTSAVRTLPNGSLMHFDKSGKIPAGFCRYKKDTLQVNADNTVTIITPQGVEIYGQDGKLQTEVDLNSRRLNYIYSDGSSVNGVDERGELATVTVPEGVLIRIESDEQTQMLFGYDEKQRLTAVRLPGDLKVLHEYEDNQNNLIKTKYPDGSTESYHYENTSYPTALTGITDAIGTRYATYEYDSQGRVSQTSLVGGVGGYRYDYGSLSWGASRTTVWNALEAAKVYQIGHFSDYARISNDWQSPGAGSPGTNRYFYYNNDGDMTAFKDYDRGYTEYTYDSDRKLELTSIKEGKKTSKQWHSFWPLETGIAQPNLIKYWVYNGQQNPLTGETTWCAPSTATIIDNVHIAVVCNYIEQPTTDSNGTAGFNANADGAAQIWSYSYDTRGNRLTSDGPRTDVNDITTYTYWPIDAECPDTSAGAGMDKGCRGQLKTETNALGHTTHYLKYDAQGKLLHKRDPKGIESFYHYDAKQRLTNQTEAGVTDEFSYDIRGLLIHRSIGGKLELDYQYDAAHRLIGIQDNQGNSISYTLDAAGNITHEQVTDPQGNLRRTIERQYDALSRVQREQKGV